MIKLDQSGIKDEDRAQAIGVKNYLLNGNVVIGNPGLGLKKTLSDLEKQKDAVEHDITDWVTDDVELSCQIAKTKAGIEGEEQLCEYLAKLLKYDDLLEGVIAFASLSYEQSAETAEKLGYIPDTDTLLVYGNNILIIDAKNLKVKPGKTLRIEDGVILDEKDKEYIEVHPSTQIWTKALQKNDIKLDSIDGFVCIVSKTMVDIERNDEWYQSNTKLIHIAELRDILHKWVEGKDSTMHLNLLTEIAKAQIREEKSTLDLSAMKKQFGV